MSPSMPAWWAIYFVSVFFNLARLANMPTGLYIMLALISLFYLFSPLGKLAGRAIYFTCVNFFLFFLN